MDTENIPISEAHNLTSQAHTIAFMSPEIVLVILTWFVFFLLLFILNKFAWGPILHSLNQREALIRQSVENADRIKAELDLIYKKRDQVLSEAEISAKEIINQSRKAAIEASEDITRRAKEESEILFENAQREINEAAQMARDQLKMTSANLAIELASQLIKENLDDEKNKKLVNELIKDL